MGRRSFPKRQVGQPVLFHHRPQHPGKALGIPDLKLHMLVALKHREIPGGIGRLHSGAVLEMLLGAAEFPEAVSLQLLRQGNQIGKHRKVHLFDIDVKGGLSMRESDTLTAGNCDTVFDTEFGKMGVIICFDIRFPELSRMTVNDGAQVIFVPAAFNMTTGPAHWELSFRARALDNQVYMVGCAPMRDASTGYTSWGHSIVTNPWGGVDAMLDEKEGVLLAELSLDYEAQVREELPLLKSRRHDVYRLEKLCEQDK